MMTDEKNTEEENFTAFDELTNGLNSGIQTVLDSFGDNEVEYILCAYQPEQGLMSVHTNAQPKDALDIVMRVGERMHGELNNTKPKEPKIILTH